MTEHGAELQTYNQELVKCLDDLRLKQSELQEIIHDEETEKMGLERNLRVLQDKIKKLDKSLANHRKLCDGYGNLIKDTEHGFKKILESSQTLLNLAQHESNKLDDVIKKTGIERCNVNVINDVNK